MPNIPVRAAAEGLPKIFQAENNYGETVPAKNGFSRRSVLGALAALPAALGLAEPAEHPDAAAASAQRAMTAHERYEHHLAELKKAAEEIDPRIAHWSGFNFLGDESNSGCGMMISAHLRKGRYEGDGIYETEYSGLLRVTLLADRQDGKRMFAYSGPKGRHEIPEDQIEAFIVRKVF